MRTSQVGRCWARSLPLLLASVGLLALAGCQTVVSTIVDTNPAGTNGTTQTTSPTTTTPTTTTTPPTTSVPVAPTLPPTVPPTPLPTTLSPALNASSIFIGASIINRWPLPVHNAGIPGQISSQVLQRFSNDVLNHGYVRVIIQVGSNDILQQVKDPPSTVSANIALMGQEARAANIAVYVISLGPITYGGQNLDASVIPINASLRALTSAQGYGYVDIFPLLQGHPEYFVDGLHPNAAGYAIIEKALARVITQ